MVLDRFSFNAMIEILHHYQLNHVHQQGEIHPHLLDKIHMIQYHHHRISNRIYKIANVHLHIPNTLEEHLLIEKSSDINW